MVPVQNIMINNYCLYFSITWLNRIGNETVVAHCLEAGSIWKCNTVFTLQQKNGWISEEFAPLYNQNGSAFLIIVPSFQTKLNRTYRHIGKKEVGGNLTMLTSGAFVVTKILGWDVELDTVYFMGTGDNRPGDRHLYSVNRNASMLCLTCTLKVSYILNINGK
jgi:hypothetical protein